MRVRDVSFVVRREAGALLVAVLACLVSGHARAQEVCYRWYSNNSQNGIVGQFFPTANSAGQAAVDYRNANPQISGSGSGRWKGEYTFVGCSADAPVGAGGTRSCSYTMIRVPYETGACSGSGGTVNCSVVSEQSFTVSYQVDPAGCPPPEEDECEYQLGSGKWVHSDSPITGAMWCEGSCTMVANGSQCSGPPELRTCLSWVSVAALTCEGGGSGTAPDDPGDDPPETVTDDGGEPSDTPGEECVDVGDGEYCASSSGGDGQCGYMNDTYVCLDRIRPDECKPLADGSRVCGGQASGTPPVPDNGTPGQPATPDGQLTSTPSNTNGTPTGVTNTYNYYSSGTVAGSARDPGTTGAGPDGGSPHQPSHGDADGDGQGDCNQVSGGCGDGQDIESNGPCYAEGEGALGVLEACGTAAFDELRTQVTGSDFYVLVTGLADSVPSGGACPSAGFSAFGEDYDFGEVACDFVEGAGSVLSVMFYLLWSLIGLRILMGAFGGGE